MRSVTNTFIYLGTAVLIAIGALLVVAGENGDSPGLGGIGLILALGALVLGIKHFRSRA